MALRPDLVAVHGGCPLQRRGLWGVGGGAGGAWGAPHCCGPKIQASVCGGTCGCRAAGRPRGGGMALPTVRGAALEGAMVDLRRWGWPHCAALPLGATIGRKSRQGCQNVYLKTDNVYCAALIIDVFGALRVSHALMPSRQMRVIRGRFPLANADGQRRARRLPCAPAGCCVRGGHHRRQGTVPATPQLPS